MRLWVDETHGENRAGEWGTVGSNISEVGRGKEALKNMWLSH